MGRFSGTAIGLATALAVAPCSWAQPSPSVDQLINALKPTAGAVENGRTRGIRRLDPQPEPAAGATAAAPRPRQQGDAATPVATASAAAPSASLYVQVRNGSAELTPQATEALDKLGTALTSSTLSPYRFRIEGHTDTVGSQEYNRSLSERRAAVVADYVERIFGLDTSRLVAVGLGSEHLLVPTPDQTPEARIRRVQIINLGV